MESTVDMSSINGDDANNQEARIGSGSKRGKNKTWSTVWNEFESIDGELYPDKVKRAKCKHCKVKEDKADSTIGTKNLLRHLAKCEKYQSSLNGNGSNEESSHRKLDEATCREWQCRITIKHGLPYSYVEYEEVRGYNSYLNPDVKHVCRNTHKNDIARFHKKLAEQLKSSLGNLPGRICLTSDIWTSLIDEGYLCVTAHYVDIGWKLKSKVLTFQHLEPPHNANILYEKIFGLLKEWRIENKIFSITLDNASNMTSMQTLLCGQLNLWNGLICRGKYFHIRCSAHILNLIVQDGLKVVSGHLKKIKESVLYVRRSEARRIRFFECAQAVGVNISKSLWLDVPTRWNSTYLMLERALVYRPVFSQLQIVDTCYEYCPSDVEWDKIVKITAILQPFYEMTTLFSGSEYPTANLYFENVWRMQKFILKAMNSSDLQIKEMAQHMNEKFQKYWEDFSIVLSFAVVLDPRYKLAFLKYCYEKLGTTHASKWLDVRDELYFLFKEYEARGGGLLHSCEVGTGGEQSCREVNSDLLDFAQDSMESFNLKSQLDLYLDEPRKPIELKLDVLAYWKENEARYPIIAQMARDILSIPITTVASESTFSMGSKILNKYRNRLVPDNVQVLLTSYNWLYGYEAEEYELKHLNGIEVELDSLTNSAASSNLM